jgi:hypothetical protein
MLSAMVKIKRAHRVTLRPSFPAVAQDEHFIYTLHSVRKAIEQPRREDDATYMYKKNSIRVRHYNKHVVEKPKSSVSHLFSQDHILRYKRKNTTTSNQKIERRRASVDCLPCRGESTKHCHDEYLQSTCLFIQHLASIFH